MTVICLLEPDGNGVADASLRALALARGLAHSGGQTLAAAIFPAEGADTAAAITVLTRFGAADLHVVEDDQLKAYAPAAWARSLAGLAEAAAATAVVAAATDHGAEVMAHLGAITGLDVAANCVAATWAAGGCELIRYRWAGSLLEDAVLEATPALLTAAADAPAALSVGGLETPAVHRHSPELSEGDLLVEAAASAASDGAVSLATARVVVGGGRGVGGPENFAPLEELAGLLGGAVGVSRVVTSQGWRPHRQQVGQTGTRIAPELYLACGISGAIQHMAGCQTAKHIVAINTDPDAPIISHADYAVIGDLNEVIPALVAALRER
jgi:electron transfer flavoprotein alpha subunit